MSQVCVLSSPLPSPLAKGNKGCAIQPQPLDMECTRSGETDKQPILFFPKMGGQVVVEGMEQQIASLKLFFSRPEIRFDAVAECAAVDEVIRVICPSSVPRVVVHPFVNSSTLDAGSLQRPVAHTTDYRAPRKDIFSPLSTRPERSGRVERGEKEGSLHRVAACVSYRTLKRSGVLLLANLRSDAVVFSIQ